MADDLYHLALAADWADARATGAYTGSTIGRTLAEEGFVHCSFAGQLRQVADRFYRGRDDVILLRIDPSHLGCEIRVEAVAGTSERYPHVYGPVPRAAVRSAVPVPPAADGTLQLP